MENIPEILVKWYLESKRDLPWRNSPSPYEVLLSEFILQQTRVIQGLNYYKKFIQKFPGIKELASAHPDEILKLWQGLGYYSRARNLHATAKVILEKYKGKIPGRYDELIRLKGIGPYTAAAIASIAFREPVAAIDGNVIRVLSRVFGLTFDIHSAAGKKKIVQLANRILDKNEPGRFNQAVMEFGALVCIPKKPSCETCVLKHKCYAYKEKFVEQLPAKKNRTVIRERFFNYLFLISENHTFIRQRNENDIWKMLYEFPLIETIAEQRTENIMLLPEWKKFFNEAEPVEMVSVSKLFIHQLTHRKIYARFFKIRLKQENSFIKNSFIKIKLDEIQNFAVPKLIEKYIEKELELTEKQE